MSPVSRRFARAAIVLTAFALIFALGAVSALAAPAWSNPVPVPNSTVSDARPVIQVNVSDPAGIMASSLTTRLDGKIVTGKIVGNTVSYQPTTALVTGKHTVLVSIMNNSWQRTSYTWSFYVSPKPVIGPMTPADGSTIATDTPAISAMVSTFNGQLGSFAMTVDGASVPATYDSGTKMVSYTPSPKLRNDAVHTAALTVTDTAGASSSVTWSFTVQIYADMVDNTVCSDCHFDYPAAHSMENCDNCHGYAGPIGGFYAPPDFHPAGEAALLLQDCASCHTGGFPTVPTHTDLKIAHTASTDMSGCACHVRSLTIEHNRWVDQAGSDLTCASCHGQSVEQRVKDALAAGITECTPACHAIASDHPYADVDHLADIADVTDASGFLCTDCHAADLKTEHDKASSSSSDSPDGCDTCHATPRDSFGAWNQSCAQGGCHVTKHAGTTTAHAFATPVSACLASGCHDDEGADLAAVHSEASTVTPDGTLAGCLVCHASGVPTTKDCATCHPDRTEPHGYDPIQHTATDTASLACATAGCHEGAEAMPLHPGGCGVCHANEMLGDLTAGKTRFACPDCHTTQGSGTPPAGYHLTMAAKHTAPVSDYETCGHCHHAWGSNPTKGPDVLRHAGGCTTCHNATTDLTGKTATCSSCHVAEGAGTPPAAYHRNTVAIHSPQDAGSLDCARCHETTNTRELHVTNGCDTCHATLGCFECHRMHNAEPGTPLLTGMSCSSKCHTTQGTDYHVGFSAKHTYSAMDAGCQGSGCHANTLEGAHAGFVGTGNRYPEYEDTCALCHLNEDPGRIPAGATADCATCHPGEQHSLESHTAGGPCVASGCHVTNVMTVHSTPGCDSCHGTGKTPSLVCSNCHTGNLHPAADHTSSETCGACHAVSDIVSIHGDDCSKCHSTPVGSSFVWNQSCAQSGCHAAVHPGYEGHPGDHGEGNDCESCHGDMGCGSCHLYDSTAPTTSSDAKATYTGVATVRLTATDSGGAGIKATYYQVDGGALQTGTSVVIQGPDSGAKMHTIEFWSTDNRMNTETPHKKVSFAVTERETIPPVTTSNAQATYVGTAAITLTPTDLGGSGVSATYYKLDNGAQQTGKTISIPSGPWNTNIPHTLEFWSVDGNENIETPHKFANFTVAALPDNTKPTSSSNITPTGYYMGDQAFTLAPADTGGSGVEGVYWQLDGAGGWTKSASVPVAAPATGNATHTLAWYARDNAGNQEATKSVTFTVRSASSTGVYTTSLALGATTWVDANFGATGAWGSYKIYVDDVLIGTKVVGTDATWNCPQTPVSSGGHIDIVADCGFTSAVWIFDQDRPHTYTIQLPSGVTQLEASTWTGFSVLNTASDWYDGYEDDYTAVWLNPGTVSNIVYGTSVAYDTVAPTGTMSVDNNAAYTGTTVATVNSNITDAISSVTQMSVDPGTGVFGAWATYSASYGITLPSGAGTKTVRVKYRDVAGNVLTLTDTIILETTPPTGTMSVNNNAVYTGSTAATVNSNVTDAGSGIADMSVDPGSGTYGPWVTYAASYPITLPAGTGTKTVRVQYRDTVGNVLARTDTIVLDQTAPNTTNNAVSDQTYTGPQVFALSPIDTGGSGLAGTWWQLDGQSTWTSGISVAVPAPPTGTVSRTISWYSRDNAGNIEATKTVTFSVESLSTGGVYSTTMPINEYTWVDAWPDSSGPWATYQIYLNDVLIATKNASADGTFAFPERALTGASHIDITIDCGFTNTTGVFDQVTPRTFTLNLPTGATRLEAATWTGFPNVGTDSDWWDDYNSDYVAVFIPSFTIGNIQYSGTGGYDTTAPIGTMSVNGGAAYAGSTSATVNSSVTDAGSGVTEMAIDPGTGTYGSWINYAASSPITLPSGNGSKTVRVQYRDGVGNILTLTDAIVLDQTAPTTTSSLSAGATYSGNKSFTLTPSDTGGSAVAGTWWQLDSTAGSWTSGTSGTVTAPASGSASHTLYWYSRDAAGNQEATKSVTFTVSAAPSTGTIRLVWGDNDVSGYEPIYDSWASWTIRSGGATGPVVASGSGSAPGWSGVDDVVVPVSATPYYVYIDWWDADWEYSGPTIHPSVLVNSPGQVVRLSY